MLEQIPKLIDPYRRRVRDRRRRRSQAEAALKLHLREISRICAFGASQRRYRFLLPVIPKFRRRYPDIDIGFNDRLVDVVEDGLDAVIRSGALHDSRLMSHRLGSFCFVLCASPSCLERNGFPQAPHDLETHDCLRFRFPTSGKLQAWQLKNADGVDLPSSLGPDLQQNGGFARGSHFPFGNRLHAGFPSKGCAWTPACFTPS
nr:LysR substrate-binding domain-containing protein [Rhizobium acidisoli]